MDFWMALWKAFLIGGLGIFAVMAVIVTIGGALDIRRMIRDLTEVESPDSKAEGRDG